MALHTSLGKEAEEMAVKYLIDHGYEILHRNWRNRHWEIDVIATKNGLLHIVEVKCLKNSRVRFPEQSVTKTKFKFLQRAADEFLSRNPKYRNIQFDIIAITLNDGDAPELFLIEDVFL